MTEYERFGLVFTKTRVYKFGHSRDVTTKLSLGGNNDVITELFLPRGSLFSDIPAGDGKHVNLFLRCNIVDFNFGYNWLQCKNNQLSHICSFVQSRILFSAKKKDKDSKKKKSGKVVRDPKSKKSGNDYSLWGMFILI